MSDVDEGADWADQTRRVLTRDLLVRASFAQPGEARALEFRALHLNLPLAGEIADRLRLTRSQRAGVEHAALDGLHEAVRAYDPFGSGDFAEFADSYVEGRIRAELALPSRLRRRGRAPAPERHPVRLAVHRLALVLAQNRA